MNVDLILQKVDDCYAANNGQEAERLMHEGIEEAVKEQDDSSLLQLLNELLGYYRETSRVEESYAVASQAISLAERMGLVGSIPYATTLLNVANAYRAGGKLQESLKCYLKVRETYKDLLAPDNMLAASLENNMSLLYQEMGEFSKAKECLLSALSIVEAKAAEGSGTEFEVAVTYANLANTCLQIGDMEEAYSYAEIAVADFEKMGVEDAHYGAALTAMGTYYYKKEDYKAAVELFGRAMNIMEKNLGRNEFYYRLQEYVAACRTGETLNGGSDTRQGCGMQLCREYYETYGKPMLEEKFPEYLDKIAVGLVGEGSDCFGYDDAYSRDHDWGPDFCLWVTDETWTEIGEALQKAYDELPKEFKGFKRHTTGMGQGRRGAMTISSFYKRLLQADSYEKINWRVVSDESLAAAVNGEVFRDDEGVFTSFRNQLKQGCPLEIRYLKLAESAARFAQTAQYNYNRMLKRGDNLTAQIMLADGMREAMKLYHYLCGVYPPHDKWLHRSMLQLPGGAEFAQMLSRWGQLDSIEQTAESLALRLYEQNFISDTEPYLDAHTPELLYKARIASKSIAELSEDIAALEFEAFDKVRNVGGRASCQNDWATFSIMRKSQYLTWNHTMLLQYLYDFDREYRRGHNLIEEKYGRMMESTSPDEYEKIKTHFPVLSPEKKQIIEQIVGLQVGWMEEFAAKYPALADNARSVHTGEDNLYNTSYETYLRGEISTYSDKMLELYGRYVVEYARTARNLTFDIMTNSVKLYGYESLEAAEKFMEL